MINNGKNLPDDMDESELDYVDENEDKPTDNPYLMTFEEQQAFFAKIVGF